VCTGSRAAEIRRLQDFMLHSVEPRIQGAQVQAVPVGEGHAVVVRVPQSWAGPHRSRMNFHFYVRDGLRNRQLDVPEIRALFLRSDSQAQRMRDFRSERLAKIVTGQTPVPLGSGAKLIVHAISTQAAQGDAFMDPVPYANHTRTLPAVGSSYAAGVALNLDGAYGELPGGGVSAVKPGYTQQFRQGYFEAVCEISTRGESGPRLPGIAYERDVNGFLSAVRSEFAAHGLAEDLAVFLSIVGADVVSFAGPSEFGPGWGHSEKKFDRKDVLLPDVLIEPGVSIGRGMRPAFDLMCQAAGYLGSANYGEDGEWKAAR